MNERDAKFPFVPNTFVPKIEVVVAAPRLETFENRFWEKRAVVVEFVPVAFE